MDWVDRRRGRVGQYRCSGTALLQRHWRISRGHRNSGMRWSVRTARRMMMWVWRWIPWRVERLVIVITRPYLLRHGRWLHLRWRRHGWRLAIMWHWPQARTRHCSTDLRRGTIRGTLRTWAGAVDNLASGPGSGTRCGRDRTCLWMSIRYEMLLRAKLRRL